MPTTLGGAGPVGVGVHDHRAHSHSVSGTLLGVASFAAYEEHAEASLGDLGWEDAEGSPDPDFLELPPVIDSPHVKVEVDKVAGGQRLRVEPPNYLQKAAPVTKNASIVTASAPPHLRSYYAQRL